MALTYDTSAGVAAGTTDRSFDIVTTGGATPQGVLVIIASTAATDEVVGVTCDGVAMTQVPLSPILQAGGEGGSVHAFFLGSGLSAGTQTIAVDAGASSWAARGYTIFAAGDTYIHDTSTSSSTSTAAPSATLTIKVPSAVFGGLYSGSNTPGSTAGTGVAANDATADFGSDTGAFAHGNSIKSTDFAFGWTQTADDGTVLVIAVAESAHGYGQAQAQTKSFGVKSYAQAQARLRGPYFIQAVGGTGGPVTSISTAALSAGVQVRDIIYVSVLIDSNVITGVSDSLGNTYIQWYATALPSGKYLYTYYSIVTAAGTPTITATFSSSNGIVDAAAYRPDPFAPAWLLPYASATATGTSSTAATAALTHGFTNIGIAISNTGSTLAADPHTVSSSFQRRITDSYTAHSDSIEDALLYSSNVTPTVTLNASAGWAINAISFQPAGLGFGQAQSRIAGRIILVSDSFNRADQSNLGTPDIGTDWLVSGAFAISSNEGTFTESVPNVDSAYIGNAYGLENDSALSFKLSLTAEESSGESVRLFSRSPSGYRLEYNINTATSTLKIFRNSVEKASVGVSIDPQSYCRIRLLVTGSGTNTKIQGKVWQLSSGEPSNWMVTWTEDVSGFSENFFGLEFETNRTTGNIIFFDNYISTDPGYFSGLAQAQAVITASLSVLVFGQAQAFIPPTKCYFETVMANSPKYYWRAGESSGDLIDEIAGKVLQPQAGGPTYSVTGALSGDSNTAISSTATSNTGFKMATDDPDFEFGDGPFSIEVWAKKISHGGTTPRIIFTKGRNWSLLFYGDKFSVEPDTSPSHEESSASADGNWHHYVVTRGGGTNSTHIYRDGVDVTTTVNDSLTYTNHTSVVALAQYYTSGFTLTGSADEPAVYNRVLTPSEVLVHYLAASNICTCYYDDVIADVPISYYRFGESSGVNATDEMGVNTGTYVNTPTLGVVGALSGDSNTAVTLNGSTQRITIKSSKILSDLTNVSVEAWIKTTHTGEQVIYAERAATGNDLWVFYVASGGTLAFKHRDDANTFTSLGGNATVNAGGYRYVVMTKSGTTVRLYVDGVDVDGGTLNGTDTLTDSVVSWAGQTLVDGSFFLGDMDELSLYNYVLTADQIRARYNSRVISCGVVISNAFSQSQAAIRAIGRGFGQANSDIKAIGQGFGQAQANIKQTYQAYAQAQADIKVTSRNFAQSQADIKATTNIFAQSQADIKQTYIGCGQAQANIKQIYRNFAQAQANIKATSHSYAQAQANIKQTYQAYAQTQADIKQTYREFAQAQADIKQTYRAYAQAQACVKGNAFVQAQAYIKVVNIEGFAQAQSDIKATSNSFAQAQADIEATSSVFAQSQADIKAISRGFAQAQSDIKQVYQSYAQAQSTIEATTNQFAQAQASVKATYNSFAQANADIKAVGRGFGQGQAEIKATYQVFAQAQSDIKVTSNAFAQSQAWIEATYNQFAQSQADIKATSLVFAQAQAKINAFNVQAYAQALANIKGIDIEGVGQAQAKINAFGVQGYGQAQSQIKATYNAFAQANSDIKAIYFVFAQAQADIKAIYFAFAQANAEIKQTYQSFAQAQADIKTTYQVYAQAQAEIKTTYVGCAQAQAEIKQTYQSYAQSQAQIKQVYNGFAQANADIKATVSSCGQAQADIKQIYQGYAQAQATIAQAYQQFTQAQARILATYNAHAQAQATVRGNAFANAQADIKQIYFSFAQSQAQIKQAYFSFAQAQSEIKQTYNAFAQAQADIKATSQVYGQAQAEIKQIYQAYANAQADISTISYTFGQSQCQLRQTYSVFAQAQAEIKATSNAFAQAQGTILTTYQAYGQSAGYIKVIGINVHAQTQSDILTTYQAYAQANARIIAFGVQAYAQAQSNIKFNGNTVSGQAQAKINALDYNQHGQALGSIRSVYNGLGQAQAAILATYTTFAQSQADILQTYQGYGQSQAEIKATYQGYAQANALIVVTDNNQSGNSQATIRATHYGFAQAAADILAQSQAYGQAQSQIGAVTVGYGQAQGTVKTTYNIHAQSNSSILETSTVFGQAQADILRTFQSYAQAQAQIVQTEWQAGQGQGSVLAVSNVSGNAQALIRTTCVMCGQSQAQITVTSQVFGQANAQIILVPQDYSQAQALIKTTVVQCAQARARIRQTYRGYAQANSLIKATSISTGQAQGNILAAKISTGQAQAYLISGHLVSAQALAQIILSGIVNIAQAQALIIKSTAYAQAQALIRVAHQLKSVEITDRPSIILTTLDRVPESFGPSLRSITVGATDRASLQLTTSDRNSVTILDSDRAY